MISFTPFLKPLAMTALGLLAIIFAIIGGVLANRDGYFSGGICIALSPVFAFVCGMMFYDFVVGCKAIFNQMP